MKDNLAFYKHEVGSDDHWKFKMLRVIFQKEFDADGWAGEGRFWALNNRIAESKNCHLDLSHEIKKLSIAADLNFTIDQFNIFLDILVNRCHLVKVAEDGSFYTELTLEIFSSVQEDRENARQRKRESRGKQKENPRNVPSQQTPELSHVTPNESHGTSEKSLSDQEQSKVNKSKVNKSKEIPDSDEPGNTNKNHGRVGVKPILDVSGLATRVGRKKNIVAAKKKIIDVEPYQDVYVEVFSSAWKELRKTKFKWDPKDFSAIKKISKKLRSDIEDWSREVARSEFENFVSKAKHDSLISKNDFENFTIPMFLNRFNSINSINISENGKSNKKNWKGNLDNRPVIDPSVTSSGKF